MTAPSDPTGLGPSGPAPCTTGSRRPQIRPPRRPRRRAGRRGRRRRCGTASGCCSCWVVIWLVVVWAAMADNPLLPFVDAVRIHVVESQWLLWLMGLELLRQVPLLRQRALRRLPPVLDRTGSSAASTAATQRAVLRLDPLPARPRGQDGRVSIVLFAVVAGPDPGAPRRCSRCSQAPALLWQALPLILQLAFAFFFIAFQFVGHLLVPVPRRRRHLLPGRHQDPVHRRLGPGPRGRAGQGEHRLPGEAGEHRGARAATSPAASCCGARPAPARR